VVPVEEDKVSDSVSFPLGRNSSFFSKSFEFLVEPTPKDSISDGSFLIRSSSSPSLESTSNLDSSVGYLEVKGGISSPVSEDNPLLAIQINPTIVS